MRCSISPPCQPQPRLTLRLHQSPIPDHESRRAGRTTPSVLPAHDAHYLLASTSEIYGDPLGHAARNLLGHVVPSVYAPSTMKLTFREALLAYHGYHGINTRIVRIFNTYGPRMGLDDSALSPILSNRRCAKNHDHLWRRQPTP
jgi:nucleoside-diphosphate-sugar epimerase